MTQPPTPAPIQPTWPALKEPEPGEPIPLSLAWDFGANAHLTSGSVQGTTGAPRFLLASLGRKLYALKGDGWVQWEVRTSGPVYSVVALGESHVATGDDSGHLTLIDAGGQRLWEIDLGSRVTHLASWQGGLLVGGWDEQLTYLDAEPAQPEVRWQVPVGGPVTGLATLSNLAVVATLDGGLEALDIAGKRMWRYDARIAISTLDSVTSASGELVLAALQDGQLLALRSGGELAWEQAMDPRAEGAPVLQVLPKAAGAEALIVVGTGGAEPELALLSPEGAPRWRASVLAPVTAIATEDLDGDGVADIVVGMASGAIQVFGLDGRLRGAAHAGLAVWHLVPARDGTVMVLADVVARRLRAVQGPASGPWLPPPEMVPLQPAGAQAAEPADTANDDGEQAILVFLGDVSPGRTMEMQLARYGPAYPWTGLQGLLSSADVAVANLEGALTTHGTPRDKSYLIRAHPYWGQTLVAAGLDMVSLANNHALDYGDAGLEETLEVLEALGVDSAGAGRSQDEAHRPAIIQVNGLRVALLAYAAARWNGSADVPATERIAWARAASVKEDVRAAREEADFVVVTLHAGTEYAAEPSPDQVAIAHAAIDAGAHLVVGHHPHVVQTVERYGQGLIVYGLGDALFDIPRRSAMLGHLLRVFISGQGLQRAELWPFWIEGAIRPRLLSDEQGEARFRVVYP